MPQFLYDQLNSFGVIDLSTSGATLTFPDVLNLDGAEIGRMTVDVKIAGALPAVSGAPTAVAVTLAVTGSNDSTFTANEVIAQRDVPLATLSAGKGSVAVSPNRYRYIRVAVTKKFTGGTSPAFTAGQIEALVNSYEGK
jgi:hypothetical protein